MKIKKQSKPNKNMKPNDEEIEKVKYNLFTEFIEFSK